jgi:hypothetical protein
LASEKSGIENSLSLASKKSGIDDIFRYSIEETIEEYLFNKISILVN